MIEKAKVAKTIADATAFARNKRSLFLRNEIKSCRMHANKEIEAKAICKTSKAPTKKCKDGKRLTNLTNSRRLVKIFLILLNNILA
jgi:hypothetical protein